MTQLQELSKPFPASLVKRAPQGKYGDYVKHSTVTERLLSTVGPFSFEIVEVVRGYAEAVKGTKGTKDKPTYPARDNAIVGCLARLELTIDGMTRAVTEAGDVEEPAMNHDGANLKEASSDAIKRCAMRFGLGLHLWSQECYFLEKQLSTDETGDVDPDAAVLPDQVADQTTDQPAAEQRSDETSRNRVAKDAAWKYTNGADNDDNEAAVASARKLLLQASEACGYTPTQTLTEGETEDVIERMGLIVGDGDE